MVHDHFELRIVTPSRLLLDERVREVTAPGSAGEFGVLPDHIAFLTSLEGGTISYRTDRGVARVAVRGGFAEVLDNVMTVLADDAAFPGDIDVARAATDLQSAESELQTLASFDDAFDAAMTKRRWAQARVDAARTPP